MLDEIKEVLVKKLGSYLMVAIYNKYASKNNLKVEIIDQRKRDNVTDLKLKVGLEEFDVFSLVTDCIENDFIYGNDEELAISMDSFFKQEKEFENKVNILIENGMIFDESKISRNDPCPCGSGKKYKKCHGKNI